MMTQRCALLVMLLVVLSQSMRLWAASEPYARLSTDCTTLTFYDNEGKTTDDYSLPTDGTAPRWSSNSATVTTVIFDKSFAAARPTTCQGWFYGMSSLTTISGIEYLNTSEVTSMLNMFNGCSRLTSLDLSGFDTGNVTTMNSMFNGCSSLTGLDLSSFRTSKVNNMAAMFSGCQQLSSVNVSGFDTQAVTEMDMMFKGCQKLTELDLTSFNTANVYSTAEMFAGCEQLTRIDASSHLVTTKVSYSTDMFTGCISLQGAVAYDSEKTDATMAQASTGYLTLVTRTYVRYADHTLTFSSDASYDLGVYSLPTDASEAPDWLDDADGVEKVVFDYSFAQVRPTTCALWFRKMASLTTVEGIENLNTSEVTSMQSLFDGCKQLTGLDLSGFVTDKVTDMSRMFSDCQQLTELDLSSFNTSAVTRMGEMFSYCGSLQKLNVSSFDTHAVTSMLGMFAQCASLTALDVTGLVTDNVSDMGQMFEGCKLLTSLDLSSFHTDKVTSMSGMFDSCAALQTLDLTTFNTAAVEEMSAMFADCAALTRIDVSKRFVTTSVTQSALMFKGCTSLQGAVAYDSEQTDVSMAQWTTGYLTLLNRAYARYADHTLTFYYDSFYEKGYYLLPTDATTPTWLTHDADVEKVVFDDSFSDARPTSCYQWFSGMSHLATIEGLSYLNTSEVTTMSEMFSGCTALTSMDLSSISVDKLKDMSSMFSGCTSLAALTLSHLDNALVENMQSMLSGCSSLSELSLEGFGTSKVTNMSGLFAGCKSLTELDLSGWHTDQVTDMSQMFQECSALSTLRMTGWVTSKVESMKAMFAGCKQLTLLDLFSFDTQAVTAMSEMFASCKQLTSLDLTFFNTSSVQDMSYMFAYCSALTTIHVSKRFVTTSVTSSVGMFQDCTSLVGVMAYDSSKTDGSMANQSGYFTLDLHPYVRFADQTLTFYDDGYYNQTDYDLPTEGASPSWLKDHLLDVKKVVFDESFSDARPTTCYQWFSGMRNLETIEDIGYLNTTEVTTMSHMFSGCHSLTELLMSSISTDKVKDMSHMFEDCASLTELKLLWTNRYVENMEGMFMGCEKLSSLTLSQFGTSRVTNMAQMFRGCASLTELDLSSFLTGSVTNMTEMFYQCSNLQTLYIPSFNTVNVTDMSQMFAHCESLDTLDMFGLDTHSVTTMQGMFLSCRKLQTLNLSSFNTANVNNTAGMFYDCPELRRIDVSRSFVMTGVGLSPEMFQGCTSLVGAVAYDSEKTDGSMANWDTGYLTLLAKAYVHYADSTLTFAYDTYYDADSYEVDLYNEYLGFPQWQAAHSKDVTKVVFKESFAQMRPASTSAWFAKMGNLTRIEGLENLNTSKTINMMSMFDGCKKLTELDLSAFATDSVKDMESMFEECSSLQKLDLSSFRTSRVTNMCGMFYGCEKLTELDLSGFVTDSVTNMAGMFLECRSLQKLDLSTFRTENVTVMAGMFYGCEKLTELDLSAFATDSVKDMESMFEECSSLQKLDLSSFRTSRVTNMCGMFDGCKQLSELNLYGIRTKNVTDMQNMFAYCSSLKVIDLASFNTSATKYMYGMFEGCSELTTIMVSSDFVTTSVTQSDEMFTGCDKLVGAVAYDSEKTDAAMANSTTGYLSMPVRAYAYYDRSNEIEFYYDDDYESGDYFVPTNENQAPSWLELQDKIRDVSFDINFINARPTTCYKWFYQMPNLTSIFGLEYLNTSCVTSMEDMFNGCRSLQTTNLTGMNTSNVESMAGMFASCDSLETLDMVSFNTAAVTNMSNMFSGSGKLKRIEVSKGFVTTSVVQSDDMFTGCPSLVGAVPFDSEKTDAAMANWTTGYLTIPIRLYATLADSTMTLYYGTDYDPSCYYSSPEVVSYIPIPSWNKIAKNLTKVVIDKSVADARPTTTLGWFYDMKRLKDIEGLQYLNTSKVTNMEGMFYKCQSLDSLDLSTFQTDSVTNMIVMFGDCYSLRSLDLSSFRTDKVTMMEAMFEGCADLESLDLSTFNTAAVRNMNYMFTNSDVLRRIDVSREFVTTSCENGRDMFAGCKELIGAVAYDKDKKGKDMAQWATGYLTLKVGKNGDDNIGAVGSPLTITSLPLADDKAFVLYEECPTDTASYSRSVKNHWATLCLPFAFSAEGNSSARFYSVSQYDKDNISVTALSGTVAAGTPVLAYVTGSELSISAKDVDVVAQPANSEDGVLQGVFTQTEVADADYIIANDHFWNAAWLKSSEGSSAEHVYVAPYRASLTLAGLVTGAKPNSIGISIGEDETTGVTDPSALLHQDTDLASLLDGAELYDLQGRRLTAPQRGVIIVRKGGVSRKVVVK